MENNTANNIADNPLDIDSALRRIQERIRRTENEGEDSTQRRERQQRTMLLARDLGPRYAPDRVQLDTFEIYYPAGQQPVLDRLRALVPKLPDLARQGRGVILIGPVGTGKDRLLAALLYSLCDAGLACAWRNGLDLYGESRDRMNGHQNEAALLRALAAPDVLGISDPLPPQGDPSAWNLQLLLRIIDRRYRMLRATWITANVANEAEADERLSAPVFDRLRDGAEIVKCFWPSYRERAK